MDTGAWYALIDRRDPDHGAVVPSLQANRGRLVTSNFVIDETLTLLRYRLGWEAAQAFGEQIRAGALARTIRITPADEDNAWAILPVIGTNPSATRTAPASQSSSASKSVQHSPSTATFGHTG